MLASFNILFTDSIYNYIYLGYCEAYFYYIKSRLQPNSKYLLKIQY